MKSENNEHTQKAVFRRFADYGVSEPIKHHKVSHRRNLAPCQRQRETQARHNSNSLFSFGLYQQLLLIFTE